MELMLGLFHKDSNTFKEVRKLSAREYADYKEAASTLMRLPNDQDRFQGVLSAFVEYMDVVAHHEELIRDHRSFDGTVLRRELNSKLSNYLRATRLTSDTVEYFPSPGVSLEATETARKWLQPRPLVDGHDGSSG
jgi:hypothetical protein